jgi:hypothetical protein
LININLDLRKEPNNIIAPNLNARRFGGTESLQAQYESGRLENYPPKFKPKEEIARVVSTANGNYPSLGLNPLPVETNVP